MNKLFPSVLSILILAAFSGAAFGQLQFGAALNGAEEVPAVITNASGSASVTFDAGLMQASFSVSVFNGVGVTQSHIHCAPAGVNGPVVAFLFGFDPVGVNVNGLLSEGVLTNASILPQNPPDPACGVVITDIATLHAAMEAGRTYVNVHTLARPAGEVRGQLTPVVGGATEVLDARYLEARLRVSIDLFVNAPATAAVAANFGTGNIPLTGNGSGGFFLHVEAAPGTPIPASATITTTLVGQAPTTVIAAIKDRVTILNARYSISTQTLFVNAQSSDRVAPVPALTVLDVGPMTGGQLTVPALPVPPPSVVVVSGNGGADFQWVNVIP